MFRCWCKSFFSGCAMKSIHFLNVTLFVTLCLVLGHHGSHAQAVGTGWNLRGRVEKGYYVVAQIGTPPQSLNILVDTGSSNFAVAAKPDDRVAKYYISASSSSVQDMNLKDVDIEYTEGFWKGHLVTDLVSLPSAGLGTPVRANIVEITSSKEFFINESGWQGILGMGYTELVRPDDRSVVPFMDSVVTGSHTADVFSLQLCGPNITSLSDSTGGKFILGSFNDAVTMGRIYWTRIVKEWYYEVIVLGMKVGTDTVPVTCDEFNSDKAIVDSGTTNLHLPTNVFVKVVAMIMGSVPDSAHIVNYSDFWNGKSKLCWDVTYDPYELFPNLTIYLPSTEPNRTISLHLHPKHYILFHGKDEEYDDNGNVCYKFGISSSTTGTVLGAVLMEQYVVIFNRENKSIGFTNSDCSATSEISDFRGYPNATSCWGKASRSPHLRGMQIAMYVLLGILILCMLPVCVLLCAWCCKKDKDGYMNDTSELLDSRSSE